VAAKRVCSYLAKVMKINYLANVRIPTEKAHGLQIMKMCQAFLRAGNEVDLIVAKRPNHLYEGVNEFDHYGIKERFLIQRLRLIDMVEAGRSWKGMSVIIQNSTFALSAFLYLVSRKQDIIYSRDQFSAFLLAPFKKNIVLEMHTFPNKWLGLYGWLFVKVKKIVAITEHLKRDIADLGVKADKIIVAPDGVDLDEFVIKIDKNNIRQKLGLPISNKIILYAGHMYDWKGVYTLAEAALFIKTECKIYLIGGMEYDINKLKEFIAQNNLPNISFVGLQPPNQIPLYLTAADCLVLPNSGKRKISRLYTSPIKLFEYMASGVPIVASKLPSIEEILNKENSILVEPDHPKALAAGIDEVFSDNRKTGARAERARQEVEMYTWQHRVTNILDFID
jgi:glycosyltransferase involved in cell wall biosynthesis